MRLVARVEALQAFLKTDDGDNLLAGYQARRQHPQGIEEKKDGRTCEANPKACSPRRAEEIACSRPWPRRKNCIAPDAGRGGFRRGHAAMARLARPGRCFFERVRSMPQIRRLRENRLAAVVAASRAGLHQVARFFKIEG